MGSLLDCTHAWQRCKSASWNQAFPLPISDFDWLLLMKRSIKRRCDDIMFVMNFSTSWNFDNRNVVCDVYVHVDNRRPILDRFKSTIRARNRRFWKKNTPAENLDGPLEHGCLPNFFRVYYIQIDVRIDVRVEMLWRRKIWKWNEIRQKCAERVLYKV